MRRAATFILLVFACHQLRALPEHSVSPSRQFVIYGAAATLRGAISELAEQTKTNLLALLRQRDGWKTAIVINLQTQQANLPAIPPDACFTGHIPSRSCNCSSMRAVAAGIWRDTSPIFRMGRMIELLI